MIKRWSKRVTETSHTMALEKNVFKSKSAKAIAKSLKASAENSAHLKSTPFRSAMSMLNFYINRAGRNLTASNKKILEEAKNELRKLFGRPILEK